MKGEGSGSEDAICSGILLRNSQEMTCATVDQLLILGMGDLPPEK